MAAPKADTRQSTVEGRRSKVEDRSLAVEFAIVSAWLCGLLACSALPPRRASSRVEDDPRERLARATLAADAAPQDAWLAAQAGFLRYLVASDPAGAEGFLRRAAESKGGQARALALCGLAEIAQDRIDAQAAAGAWIAAIAAEPGGPFAELAAARLLEAQGESQAVDDAVLAAAESLGSGTQPRAARFLREAAARVHGSRAGREGPQPEAVAWARLGAVQRWRIAGPFAALRLFDLARPLPLDGAAPAPAPAVGPAGNTGERALEFPDGDVGLDLEPADGDVFYAESEIRLSRGGDYLAWIEGAGALELRLDGRAVISRVPYPRELARQQTAAVRLSAGKHEALVRWSRAEGDRFRFALVRADGAPSDAESSAPAKLTGFRGESPCPLGRSCIAPPAWETSASLFDFAEAALRRDAGDPLVSWLFARALAAERAPAARAAVDRAVARTGGAAALALRAQEELRDPDLPEQLGRSRAFADVTQALGKDASMVQLYLLSAELQREAERFDEAAQQLDRAEAVLAKMRGAVAAPPASLLVARARLLAALGNTAAARDRAKAALDADPGRCSARALLAELARRDGGLAELRRSTEQLLGCADGAAALAAHLRERGELERAQEFFAQLAAQRPAQPARREALAEAQAARGQSAAALESLRAAAQLAPRSPEPLRRLAILLEAHGDDAGAATAREAALRLAPGDLALRRQIASSRGEELLSWADRDALAIARDDGRPGTPPELLGPGGGAPAIRLLDHGAAQIFPDGGAVERVHTVARVLDKKGVTRFGEQQIPPGAEVLRLRTLKKDGRILEPEAIPEKESISLPALEPGDALEVDYLHGVAPRGPELPGFTLGGFFFQDEETPMRESTYEVRAPASSPLELDAHHLATPPIERLPGEQRWRYEARDVPPREPEPNQPTEAEILPWAQVGAGATQRELVLSFADWGLLRARPGGEIDELAARAQASDQRARARQIFFAVAQAVRGRSQGMDFSAPAPHVLARGRGNRLLPLKAALAVAGIGSHLALVRGFGQDPSPYRFPRGELYGFAVLRIDLPDGPAWVDPTLRRAPFGSLPPFLRGQDAWILPEPGEAPQRVRTPDDALDSADGRRIEFSLVLGRDGTAEGVGRDSHRGFDASGLKEALERLGESQRKQAVESMLGRGLRRVELTSLRAEREGEMEGPASLVYELRVELARPDGDRLLLPASLSPAKLARRFAQKAERSVPLLIAAPERWAVRAEVALPVGMRLAEPTANVALRTPFGEYLWSARTEPSPRGAKVVLEESFFLSKQRVQPQDYAAFAAFASRVDEAQEQELAVVDHR